MEELMNVFTSLEFTSPLYFWAGGVIILLGIFLPILRKKRLLRLDLGYWEKKVRLKSKKTWIVPVLMVMTAVLIAAALANPQIIEKRNIPFYGKPVMIVMDVSGSMSPGSEEVSSFDKAREVYYDIVERDLGASIGILPYSSESYVARDFAPEVKLLEGVLDDKAEIEEISSGTRTAAALYKARRFFSEETQAKDKGMILLSDLGDNLEEVGQEIKRILRAGIKMYVIVIDEELESAYQNIQELQKETGQEQVMMVWAEDKEGINQICEEIRQMETSLTGEVEILSQQSLARILLPAILGLVILCIVLSETISRKIP